MDTKKLKKVFPCSLCDETTSNENSTKKKPRRADQKTANAKRTRGRPRKVENEMPKTARVVQKRDSGNSRCESHVLKSCSENSYTGEQVQMSTSGGNTELNIDEIKTILRDIGKWFVELIIEGVHKEMVLEALSKIQTIKSFLTATRVSCKTPINARQPDSVGTITHLMNSSNYLMMLIENYRRKFVDNDLEGNWHDQSFDDMFQDNIHDTQDMSLNNQDSLEFKSILKTTNDDSITRKRISFAEKATKVYQDNETSQISLAKSSLSAKGLEGLKGSATSKLGDSVLSGIRNSILRPTNREPTSELLAKNVELIEPSGNSTVEESYSIIESSFLNDSVSNSHTNLTNTMKNIRPRIRNVETVNKSHFAKDETNNFVQVNQGKCSLVDTSTELKNTSTELRNLLTRNTPPHITSNSDLFSDELFFSQITENCGGESIPKHSENVSVLKNTLISLPGSSSQENSLDTSVRMAVNIATTSIENSRARNDESPNMKDKSERIWRLENSTEIIPNSEKSHLASRDWIEPPRENVKGDNNLGSGNSSLNVSLLFEETDEASWIPGTFSLQDINIYKDETHINTKQIQKEQEPANQGTKCEANVLQVGLKNTLEEQDYQIFEPHYHRHHGPSHNAPNDVKVSDMPDSLKQQDTSNKQDLFSAMENSVHPYKWPQETDKVGEPSEMMGPSRIFFPAYSGTVFGNHSKQVDYGKGQKVMEDSRSDVPNSMKNLLNQPVFHPPTQISKVLNQQQPVLSFSDVKKMHIQQELTKTPRIDTTVNEIDNTKTLESKAQQSSKKNEHPSSNDNSACNNQQRSSPLTNLKLKHSDKGIMKTLGLPWYQRVSSDNEGIDNTTSHKPNPANCSQKNRLEEHIFPTHVGDSNREGNSLISTEHNRIENVKIRFQETLLTGHWLKSGLQEGTLSNFCPSLNPISNLSHLGEIQQNQEINLNKETYEGNAQVAELRNPIQSAKGIHLPEVGNSVQRSPVTHSKLNAQPKDLWKPSKYSSFFAFTLSDTDKYIDGNHEQWTEQSNNKDTNKTHESNLSVVDKLHGKVTVCPQDNSWTAYGVSGTISKNTKSCITVDNLNSHLGNSLFNWNSSDNELKTSINSTNEATRKGNQSHIINNKDEGKSYPSYLITQPQGNGGVGCSNYFSKTIQPQKSDVDQQGSTEEIKENRLNLPDAKLEKRGSKKRLSTPSRSAKKKKNESIDDADKFDESIIENSQNQKSRQSKKSKTTKNNSTLGRVKPSTPTTEILGELTYNAQNLDTTLNWSTSNVNRSLLGEGPSAQNGYLNCQNILRSEDVFQPHTDVKRNKKIEEQKTVSAGINKQGTEFPALGNNQPYQVHKEWTYQEQKPNSQTQKKQQSNYQTGFNLSNRNTSINGEDISHFFQAEGKEIENDNTNMQTVKTNALQSTKNILSYNERESTEPGSGMSFMESLNLSWNDNHYYKNADGNSCRTHSGSNKPGIAHNTQAITSKENSKEYSSLTQLSWGESAICEIPSTPAQGCYQPANIRINTIQEQLDVQNNVHPNPERSPKFQSLTQLSWGQSATCGITTFSPKQLTTTSGIGKSPPISKAAAGQIQKIMNIPANNGSVFKQPFAPNPTISFTEFMQDVSVTSTEKILDSPALPPKQGKTDAEEIEDILNSIEFVRVPQESELIEANSIEELFNDQTFIW